MANDPDRAELDLLIHGFQISRMIRAAADLALPDRIAPGEESEIGVLATVCAVEPMPLRRLVRALAAFGIFRMTAGDKVAHSPRSLLLRSDATGTLFHAARFYTAPGSWRAWGMLDAALAGETPYRAAWNMSRFEYLGKHAEEARIFDAHMAHHPGGFHEAIASAYDFSAAALIVDVGGGNGSALRHILARFPAVRGVVLDLPPVVAAVGQDASPEGRLEGIAGDFFERVPAGADLYLLVRVLHDWSDEDCLRILRTCRAAAGATARLLIGEQILEHDPQRGDPLGYLMDVHTMAMFGDGRERSLPEFRELLTGAGFAYRRTIPTTSALSLIEAEPG
jgi:SAM-dependent methyltransferase